MVALAVVVDNRGFLVIEPLEHTTLLPAPGVGFGERREAVAVLQVNHAKHGGFLWERLTGGEGDFMREQIASRLVPGEFVEVTEEVVLRAFGDPLDGKVAPNHPVRSSGGRRRRAR